ncbi:hypothetical protein RZN22_01155 [Bacillaceae bacterium S4-13-58]
MKSHITCPNNSRGFAFPLVLLTCTLTFLILFSLLAQYKQMIEMTAFIKRDYEFETLFQMSESLIFASNPCISTTNELSLPSGITNFSTTCSNDKITIAYRFRLNDNSQRTVTVTYPPMQAE